MCNHAAICQDGRVRPGSRKLLLHAHAGGQIMESLCLPATTDIFNRITAWNSRPIAAPRSMPTYLSFVSRLSC